MTCTRPDLCYVVSQNLSKPTKSHCGMAKQVLRYLKGTYDRCLKFVKGPQPKLVGLVIQTGLCLMIDAALSINQSFILTRYVKELKNSLIRTRINISERILLRFKIKVRCWKCSTTTLFTHFRLFN